MVLQARRAKRQQLIAAVATIGPSGAGKTLGNLLMAYGMMKAKYPEMEDYDLWGKIALVDTEHERSLVYEGMTYQGVKIGEFIFINLEAPYSVSRYDEAQKLAKKEGAEIVVFDSISHCWESEGGLLELQNDMGGRYQDWHKVNPMYREFISIVTGEKNRVHTFSTIRSKQKYEVSQTDTGKLEVKKLGLAPVQRESLEYEFQLVFSVDMDHVARTLKDNSGLFERPEKITPDHGKKLFQWLEAGIDVKAKEEEDRMEFLKFIREMEAAYNGPVSAKIKEIEDKMKMPLEQFPFNLVQLAYTRVNDVISQVEQAQSEVDDARAQ